MSKKEIKRVDPREHVLLRPDMYVGSIHPEVSKYWYCDEKNQLQTGQGQFTPALYKIFDEIITNASDNKQRDSERSKRQTFIKVAFTKTDKGTQISVENDGIENFIKFNDHEKMYVPQLAFGVLMTSSNYEDDEQRVTGGRNGFGAKLTNIYSTQFEVLIREDGKQYYQKFTDNMLHRTEPQIEKCERRDNFLKISFIPDYQKLGMEDLTTDNLGLLKRRVLDIAGCNEGLKVYLDNQLLKINGFSSYARMVFRAANPALAKQIDDQSAIIDMSTQGGETTQTSVTTRGKPQFPEDQYISFYSPHPFWDIAIFQSQAGEFQQLSFVNSINTSEGGTHIELVLDDVVDIVNDCVKKFLAKEGIKDCKQLTRAQIKNNIFVVIRCLVENPSFDSQTKVNLRTTKAQLKKTLTFDPNTNAYKKFVKSFSQNSALLQQLAALVSKQQQKLLEKNDGRKQVNIVVPKLDDATAAGTGNSMKCSLYLTEGDSAKGLVVEGITKVPNGRKFNGVFPLRGKVLNVREISTEKLAKNEEIANIKKILGLKQNCKYETDDEMKSLRYGKVICMSDQDYDGSHIAGLILNLFVTFWPNLVKRGYIQRFITPIVRCRRKNSQEVVDFYTMPELEEWVAAQPDIKKWNIQYYKGLGTSDKAECAEYFQPDNIVKNKKQFIYDDLAGQRMTLAFHKQLADKRKDWLRETSADVYLDTRPKNIKISDFVDKDLVLYEKYANIRAIPSAIDGLKPSQRKIVYASFKRKLTTPIKVVQLSGYVSENAAYHHGETSLNEAIVGLAQYFTGSNNIPLLVPKGNFGSRPRGGQDSAAPRYIFTCLQPIMKYIFNMDDDPLYDRVTDDSQVVEPIFYAPVIPMVLANGAVGIGTGYSTSVPQFNVHDIIKSIRLRLYKRSTRYLRYGTKQMLPHYNGWTGRVIPDYFDVNKQIVEKWTFEGKFEVSEDNKAQVIITELPPQVWTEAYREMLQQWMIAGKSDEKAAGRPNIINVQDLSDNDTVNIVVTFGQDFYNANMKNLQDDEPDSPEYQNMLKILKLTSSFRTTNMVLHNDQGQIQYFKSTQQIIDDFYKVRIHFYELRKQFLLDRLQDKALDKSERARFIQFIIDQKLKVQNVKKPIITENLWKQQFMPTRVNRLHLLDGKAEGVHEDSQAENADNAEERAYLQALEKRVSDEKDRTKFFQKVNQMPDQATRSKCYQYLLDMPIYSLTAERYAQLLQESAEAQAQYEKMLAKSVEQLYLEDLSYFELAYDILDNQLQHVIINGPISVTETQMQQRYKDVEKEYQDMPKANGDSDVEPEIVLKKEKKQEADIRIDENGKVIKEKVPRAPRAPKAPKAPTEQKAQQSDSGKPKLLRKKGPIDAALKEKKETAIPAEAIEKAEKPKKRTQRRKVTDSSDDDSGESEIDLVSDSELSNSTTSSNYSSSSSDTKTKSNDDDI